VREVDDAAGYPAIADPYSFVMIIPVVCEGAPAMTTTAMCRVAGGVLIVLISVALGLGGIQLWRGGPEAWPDIIANKLIVRRISSAMIVMATLLLVAGVSAIGNVPWSGHAAAGVLIVLVAAAFWGNHALFGDMRPLHTGTNIVVAAIILALLWFGNRSSAR
jgi:hypothetical protein